MRGPRTVVLPLVALLSIACGGDGVTLPGPGDPATLTIVSGDGQSAMVGETVSQPLVVQLADGAGAPVLGATVTFRFSDDPPDAALDPSAPATDSLGRAWSTARLGTMPGDQAIDAQVATPGKDLQVRFRLTAVAKDPPGGGQQGGGDGGSAGPPPSGGGDTPSGGGDPGGNQGDGGGGGDQGGHGHGKGKGHGHGHGD